MVAEPPLEALLELPKPNDMAVTVGYRQAPCNCDRFGGIVRGKYVLCFSETASGRARVRSDSSVTGDRWQ
jgi:hypothetical protein